MPPLLVWTRAEFSPPVKQGTSTAMLYVRALVTEVRVRDLPAPEINHTTLNLHFETDSGKLVHGSDYELVVGCGV